jgi:two-component system, chemotaxis family, sensor kinase CheA
MFDQDAIVREFLLESLEALSQLEARILSLEGDDSGPEAVDAIFRSVHTIKGVANHLEYANLGALAHAGESLLSDIRDRLRSSDVDVVDALLALVDELRAGLEAIADQGTDESLDYSALVQRLQDLRVAPDDDQGIPPASPITGLAPEPEPDPQLQPLATERVQPPVARPSAARVRVEVETLTGLMNLVGELVLARNRLLQISESLDDEQVMDGVGRLDRITTELQDVVMSTRMQPIGNLWDRLPRMVRAAAKATGKQVGLRLEGADTELDRMVIEAITDPLSHMVRNSVTHGIESPEERMRWGKPAEGCITLSARHGSGQVVIELSDDGGGLDLAAIRMRAIERGLLSFERAQHATDEQLQELIFSPGFSTTAEITDLAGRGVGMDVVRTHVERIGGSVDLRTEAGEGTTFRMHIPLTLAIISVLIVNSGGERLALPQETLKKLLVIPGSQVDDRLEDFHGVRVMRFEGGLLPIVSLSGLLALDEVVDDPVSDLYIVVVEARGRRFGLIADAIEDPQEIVVKSLDPQLRNLGLYTGATTLGDGSIALILDVMGLARDANIRETTDSLARPMPAVVEVDVEPLLLMELGPRRVALPLTEIHRLVAFQVESIEWGGVQPVVQFEQGLLPLVSLAGLLGLASPDSWEGAVQVVIAGAGEQRVGLVVDRILDITTEAVDLKRQGRGPGLRGSAVLDGRVTDVVDLELLLRGPVLAPSVVRA